MLFLMFVGIFSIGAISGSPVFRRIYQHLILAIEMKNFVKVTLPSFNVTAVFLHDVMVSENDVTEVG